MDCIAALDGIRFPSEMEWVHTYQQQTQPVSSSHNVMCEHHKVVAKEGQPLQVFKHHKVVAKERHPLQVFKHHKVVAKERHV